MTDPALDPDVQADEDTTIHEDRLWRDDGWTARVMKNEDDDGWAVAMIKDGEVEPALTGPWTMGRDKKNPKPLDANAFRTLVKTASEVRRRHEQQRHAMLHKEVTIRANDDDISVTLDIVPDEDDPFADLRAVDSMVRCSRKCGCRRGSSCPKRARRRGSITTTESPNKRLQRFWAL